MAKIRGLELPDDCRDYLLKALKDLPEVVLADMGKSFLPGGLAHAHQARHQFEVILHGNDELPHWLSFFLSGLTPGRGCIEKLSINGLKLVVPALLKIRARAGILLPILFDLRPEVQRYGEELLLKTAANTEAPDKKAGSEELVAFVNTNFLHAADIEASLSPITAVPPTIKAPDGRILNRKEMLDWMADVKSQLDRFKRENQQFIRNLEEQRRKHKTRLDTITREASAERSRLITERDQALAKARRAEKEKVILAERMHKAEVRLANGIARGVAEQTSATLRKWLQAPLAVEQTVRSIGNDSDDLLTRAEEILRQQTAQDTLAGTANELEDRLTSLESAKRRLTAAALNALHLVPELSPLLMELDEHIQHARKALGLETELDPVTQRLLLTINRATNPEQARECSHLIEQAVDLDLIPGTDRRRLMDALQRKFSLLEELARGERLSASDPGWALRGVIHRDQPSYLLLDGFNILHAMGDTFRADYEPDGRPGRRAVEKLIALLRVLADPRPHVRIRVVLDSPQHQVIDLTPNLAVEYSGGTGQHRADQRIADLIEFRRPEELEEKWFVVSNDREVRRRAVASQAQPVLVDVFSVLLHDYVGRREITPATPSPNSYAA